MSQKLADEKVKQIQLEELVEAIQSREDLVRFVRALHASLKEKPADWGNADLDSYLEAVGAWIEDLDGFFKGKGEKVPKQPTWKTIGQILLATRTYE
jgi:hypothetical protein